VVVFDSPSDGTLLLKRVGAVAGDRVAVRGGKVVLGRAADEEADEEPRGAPPHASLETAGPDWGPATIPRGHLLLLGDNRGNSHDSRFFGPVPIDALRGRVQAIYSREGHLTWQPL
jgi:signal peptidase I